MRCFDCNQKTKTVYMEGYVMKECFYCGWYSYPTKIPEAIK